MFNTFVFDIETVPDVAAGRRIYELKDLSDEEVAQAMFALRRINTNSEFLPHYLQRIVAISIAFRSPDRFKVWSLGEINASESELIQRFFDGIEKYIPTLVSWNGSGFDLPVLHYRALLHGVCCPRYWELGDTDQSFRWNNYLNRYHIRHTDLMDTLAAFQSRANAPLDDIAVMLGLPGKMGMHGSAVWHNFRLGKIEQIRNYCETDVLNTYLIYLRYELMRGNLSKQQYENESNLVKETLQNDNKAHLNEFLQAWIK